MKMRFLGIVLLLVLCSFAGTAKPINKVTLPLSPLWNKLNSIKIKHIDFQDAEPETVFKLLRIRSKDLDPEGKGVNFVCKGLKDHKTMVTLKLDNLPLAEVIKYVCLSGNLDYKVDEYAVIIMPKQKTLKKNKADK